MPPSINLSQMYNSYKNWVNKNPQTTTDLEITAKWISYFIAGRINNSHLSSELIYCLSNLLVLYNDNIILNLRQMKSIKAGDHLRLYLTVIEHSEVFLELSAWKLWGGKGKWFIIFVIQIFKCIIKMLLLFKYEELIIESPPIPSLERKNIMIFDQPQLSVSFKLKHSGRVIRRVESSPPVNLRTWKGLKDDSQDIKNDILMKRQKAAEIIYTLKPLAHLGTMAYFGEKNWKPFIVALMFDLCSLHLYRSCETVEALNHKQKMQVSKRTVRLLLYLIRSPLYDKYTREKINTFLKNLSDKVPLASLICSPLIQYLPFWQSNYFYMWSS